MPNKSCIKDYFNLKSLTTRAINQPQHYVVLMRYYLGWDVKDTFDEAKKKKRLHDLNLIQ